MMPPFETIKLVRNYGDALRTQEDEAMEEKKDKIWALKNMPEA